MRDKELVVKTALPLLSTQALEKEVSDHLKARSVMSDKLKNKQKEVQQALKTLDKEVKLR